MSNGYVPFAVAAATGVIDGGGPDISPEMRRLRQARGQTLEVGVTRV